MPREEERTEIKDGHGRFSREQIDAGTVKTSLHCDVDRKELFSARTGYALGIAIASGEKRMNTFPICIVFHDNFAFYLGHSVLGTDTANSAASGPRDPRPHPDGARTCPKGYKRFARMRVVHSEP